MKNRKILVFVLGSLFLLTVGILTALAASINMDPTRVGSVTQVFTISEIVPSQCTMTIENVITGSGTITGSNRNDLILGSSGVDTINGRQGLDCILGGGGNDTINGFVGNGDVCIGGPGTDTFISCEIIVQDN